MSNAWDAHADGWDEDIATNAYADAAYRSLKRVLRSFGRSLDGANVCDFGCGTGLLTAQMAAAVGHIDAVDTSSAMLEVLRTRVQKMGWAHVRPSADFPPDVAGHDVVVCSSVLGFVDDYPDAVARLVGLLAPGGVFVQWDWESDDDPNDTSGLARAEVQSALTGAGLGGVVVDVAFEVDIDGSVMAPLIGYGQLQAA